jgi:hypothetical protein
VELDAGTQPALEEIERLGGADLVVGILGPGQKDAGSAVAILRAALGEWSKVERAVVVCVNGSHGPTGPNPDVAEVGESLKVFSWTLPALGLADTPQQSMSDAYRSVLALGGKLGVRA